MLIRFDRVGRPECGRVHRAGDGKSATHKVSCGTVDGQIADLDRVAWEQRREIRWCNERPGHLSILGKLMNLGLQQVIDDPAKLIKLLAKIKIMGEDSVIWSNGKRVASEQCGHHAVGHW